jgi:hypothetical protein
MDISKKTYEKDTPLGQTKMHEKIKSGEGSTELTLMKIMALQLELDNEQLAEWREKRAKLI